VKSGKRVDSFGLDMARGTDAGPEMVTRLQRIQETDRLRYRWFAIPMT
jgi:hypothetical protein